MFRFLGLSKKSGRLPVGKFRRRAKIFVVFDRAREVDKFLWYPDFEGFVLRVHDVVDDVAVAEVAVVDDDVDGRVFVVLGRHFDVGVSRRQLVLMRGQVSVQVVLLVEGCRRKRAMF